MCTINCNTEYSRLAKVMKLSRDPYEKFEIFNTFIESNEETDFFTLINFLVGNGVVFDCSKYIDEAIKEKNFERLEALIQAGCPLDAECCYTAAKYGCIDFLEYLHENSCPWDKTVTIVATEKDDLECLKYAVKNGCRVPKNIMYHCASSKKCTAFRYLLKLGYKINEEALCQAASCRNHLFLKLAVDFGYKLSDKVLTVACKNCDLQCVMFCLDNGCFLTIDMICHMLEKPNNTSVLQYIYDNRETIPHLEEQKDFNTFMCSLAFNGDVSFNSTVEQLEEEMVSDEEESDYEI